MEEQSFKNNILLMCKNLQYFEASRTVLPLTYLANVYFTDTL